MNICKQSSILLFVCFSMAGCLQPKTPSVFSKPVVSKCADEPASCENEKLCYYATVQNGGAKTWDSSKKYVRHVAEAKNRRLSCGLDTVASTKKTLSKTLLLAIKKMQSDGLLTSNQEQKLVLRIQKMNWDNYTNIQEICDKAFANFTPSDCYGHLKKLL